MVSSNVITNKSWHLYGKLLERRLCDRKVNGSSAGVREIDLANQRVGKLPIEESAQHITDSAQHHIISRLFWKKIRSKIWPASVNFAWLFWKEWIQVSKTKWRFKQFFQIYLWSIVDLVLKRFVNFCFYHKYLSHVQIIADLKIVIIYSQEVQDWQSETLKVW